MDIDRDTFKKITGMTFRQCRVKKNISMKKLAHRLKICRSVVSAYELGTHEPGIYNLFIMLKKIRTKPSTFFSNLERNIKVYKLMDNKT